MHFLAARFEEQPGKVALRRQGSSLTYRELAETIEQSLSQLRAAGINSGDVVFLEADYHPAGIGVLLALIETGTVIVPCSETPQARRLEQIAVSGARWLVRTDPAQISHIQPLIGREPPEPIRILRRRRHPGLVLFTSG